MITPEPVQVCFAITVAILFGLLVVLVGTRFCLVPRATQWVLATYVGHLILGLTVYSMAGWLVPDEHLYDVFGQSIAQHMAGVTGSGVEFAAGKEGWVWILGGLYYTFGHVPETGLILNAVAMALAPIAIANAAVHLGWVQSARVALIASCIPLPFIIWGSLLLREAIAILLIATAFSAASRIHTFKQVGAIMQFCLSIGGLLYIRGTAALLIGVALVVAVVFVGSVGSVGSVGDLKLTGRNLTVCLLAAVAAAVAIKVGADSYGWDLQHANISRAANASSAASSVGDIAAVTGGLSVITTSIVNLPLVVLGPYPWQWSFSGVGLLTSSDAISWAVVIYYAYRGWGLPETRRGRWVCALPAIFLFLVLTITTGAFGTLVRYRAMALPFLVPLAAAGFVAVRRRNVASDERALNSRLTPM